MKPIDCYVYFIQFVFGTYCQLKLPVIPSLSRSLRDLCLDGPEPPVNVAILSCTVPYSLEAAVDF